MSNSEGRERREFIRIAVAIPIRYRYLASDADASAPLRDGHTGNISQSGLVLVGELPPENLLAPILKKAVDVELSFAMPSAPARVPREEPREVRCRASIAWLDLDILGERCSLGLMFRDLGAAPRMALFKYALTASGRTPG